MNSIESCEGKESLATALDRFLSSYASPRFAPEDRVRCGVDQARARLLAWDSHYLKLAAGMDGGGVLFGVDQQENPLVADVAPDPVSLPHGGLTFEETVRAVHLKDPKGAVVSENLTGYEMFPYVYHPGWYDSRNRRFPDLTVMSEEVSQFQEFQDARFVRPERRDDAFQWRASWVYCMKLPKLPRCVTYNPDLYHPMVLLDFPEREGSLDQASHPWVGVRRLLRVKERPEFSFAELEALRFGLR